MSKSRSFVSLISLRIFVSLVVSLLLIQRFSIMASLTCPAKLMQDSCNNVHQSFTQIKDRYIFIGDIHGCDDEFKEILDSVHWKPDHDMIILCGDLVNKGPKSVDVIKRARNIGAYAVKGNHEEAAIKAYYHRLRNETDNNASTCQTEHMNDVDNEISALILDDNIGSENHNEKTNHGKKKDKKLKKEEKKRQKKEQKNKKYFDSEWDWVETMEVSDVEWLDSLPYTISLPALSPPILCVHAGFVPNVPIREQKLHDMTHMRNVMNIQDLVQVDDEVISAAQTSSSSSSLLSYVATESIEIGQGWASLWSGPEHVYFGHDAKRRLQQEPYATGLDTGCCYGGQLSAMVLPEGRLIQVNAHKEYVVKTKKV